MQELHPVPLQRDMCALGPAEVHLGLSWLGPPLGRQSRNILVFILVHQVQVIPVVMFCVPVSSLCCPLHPCVCLFVKGVGLVNCLRVPAGPCVHSWTKSQLMLSGRILLRRRLKNCSLLIVFLVLRHYTYLKTISVTELLFCIIQEFGFIMNKILRDHQTQLRREQA